MRISDGSSDVCSSDLFLIHPPRANEASAAVDDYRPAEIVVTAQKRVESAQDVPIAISAFSEQALQEQKIEGGFDLLKAIPNVIFSKGNFTSYNFSISGVGKIGRGSCRERVCKYV